MIFKMAGKFLDFLKIEKFNSHKEETISRNP